MPELDTLLTRLAHLRPDSLARPILDALGEPLRGRLSWLLPRVTAAEAALGGATLLGPLTCQVVLQANLAAALDATTDLQSTSQVAQSVDMAACVTYLSHCPAAAWEALLEAAVTGLPNGGSALALLRLGRRRGFAEPAGSLVTGLLEAAVRSEQTAANPGGGGRHKRGSAAHSLASTGAAEGLHPLSLAVPLLLHTLEGPRNAEVLQLPDGTLNALLQLCLAAKQLLAAAHVAASMTDPGSALAHLLPAVSTLSGDTPSADAAAVAAVACPAAARFACSKQDDTALLVLALQTAKKLGVLPATHATLHEPVTLMHSAMRQLLDFNPSSIAPTTGSAGSQGARQRAAKTPVTSAPEASAAAADLLWSCSSEVGVLPDKLIWCGCGQPALMALSRVLRQGQHYSAAATVAVEITDPAARRSAILSISKALSDSSAAAAAPPSMAPSASTTVGKATLIPPSAAAAPIARAAAAAAAADGADAAAAAASKSAGTRSAVTTTSLSTSPAVDVEGAAARHTPVTWPSSGSSGAGIAADTGVAPLTSPAADESLEAAQAVAAEMNAAVLSAVAAAVSTATSAASAAATSAAAADAAGAAADAAAAAAATAALAAAAAVAAAGIAAEAAAAVAPAAAAAVAAMTAVLDAAAVASEASASANAQSTAALNLVSGTAVSPAANSGAGATAALNDSDPASRPTRCALTYAPVNDAVATLSATGLIEAPAVLSGAACGAPAIQACEPIMAGPENSSDSQLAARQVVCMAAAQVGGQGGSANLLLAAIAAANQHSALLPAMALLSDADAAACAVALVREAPLASALQWLTLLPERAVSTGWRAAAAAVQALPPARRSAEGVQLLLQGFSLTGDIQLLWAAAAAFQPAASGVVVPPKAHALGQALLLRSQLASTAADELPGGPFGAQALEGMAAALRMTGQLRAAATVAAKLSDPAVASRQLTALLQALAASAPQAGKTAPAVGSVYAADGGAAVDDSRASLLAFAAVVAHVRAHGRGAELVLAAWAAAKQHRTLAQAVAGLVPADAAACAAVLVREAPLDDALGWIAGLTAPTATAAAWQAAANAATSLPVTRRAAEGVTVLLEAHAATDKEQLLWDAAAAVNTTAEGAAQTVQAHAVGQALLRQYASRARLTEQLASLPLSQPTLEGLSVALRVTGQLHAAAVVLNRLVAPAALGPQLRSLLKGLSALAVTTHAAAADVAAAAVPAASAVAATADAAGAVPADAQLASSLAFATMLVHVPARCADADLVLQAVAVAKQHGTWPLVQAALLPTQTEACAAALVAGGRGDEVFPWNNHLPAHLAKAALCTAAVAVLALAPGDVAVADVAILQAAHAVTGDDKLLWAAAAALPRLGQAPAASQLLAELRAGLPKQRGGLHTDTEVGTLQAFFMRLGLPLAALQECRPAVVSILQTLLNQPGGDEQAWSDRLPATAMHLAFDVCREEGWQQEAGQLWQRGRALLQPAPRGKKAVHALLVAKATAGYWDGGADLLRWTLAGSFTDGSRRIPVDAHALYTDALSSSQGTEQTLKALSGLGSPAGAMVAEQLKVVVAEALLSALAQGSNDALAAQLYNEMMDTSGTAAPISRASDSSTPTPPLPASSACRKPSRKVPVAGVAASNAGSPTLPRARVSTIVLMFQACQKSPEMRRLCGARLLLDLVKMAPPSAADGAVQPQALAEDMVQWLQENGLRGAAAAAMLVLSPCGVDVTASLAFVFAETPTCVVSITGSALYGAAWRELVTADEATPEADPGMLRRGRAAVQGAKQAWLLSGRCADGGKSKAAGDSTTRGLGLNQLLDQALKAEFEGGLF